MSDNKRIPAKMLRVQEIKRLLSVDSKSSSPNIIESIALFKILIIYSLSFFANDPHNQPGGSLPGLC